MTSEMENSGPLKINIGCGGRPLPGYINIDTDDAETLRKRYPGNVFPIDVEVFDYDIFKLPFDSSTVSEVRADALVEHLSFIEEPLFFNEVKRVLKPGGIFDFSTTNFEKIVAQWLDAVDEWKDFYRVDNAAIAEEHWFGQYSYSADNRWGYLTAMIFGSQHGVGQFHKNCYTVPKIRAMLVALGMEELDISEFLWKGDRDPMIRVLAKKR